MASSAVRNGLVCCDKSGDMGTEQNVKDLVGLMGQLFVEESFGAPPNPQADIRVVNGYGDLYQEPIPKIAAFLPDR